MSGSQIVLSKAQLHALRSDVSQLGQQSGVGFVVLADLSGQDIVFWDAFQRSDPATISALAAGDLMATLEIGRMLGGQRACNLVIQEHDEQTVLIARVGQGLLLLVSTAREVPLGWARLAIKRTVERILAVVGDLADTPPPPAITEEFETSFARQLSAIW